jgi:hypothetical protein
MSLSRDYKVIPFRRDYRVISLSRDYRDTNSDRDRCQFFIIDITSSVYMSVIFDILYTSHARQQGNVDSVYMAIFALLVDKQLMHCGNGRSIPNLHYKTSQ